MSISYYFVCMKNIFLTLLLFSSYLLFASEDKDTIILTLDELKTACPQEISALQSGFKNYDSLVKNILTAECKMQYTQKAESDIEKFNYNLNIPFYRIFEDGTYNCVTASMLYAIIFHKLNIDYEIRQTPTHVYLVAEPQTLNITIETTTPTFGYIIHDDKFKQTYVDYLVKNKIIKKEEVEQSNTADLFNKYFFKDNSISLTHLVSLLFYNKGIEQVQKDAFHEALNYFEVAYFIYPSAPIKFFLQECTKQVVIEDVNSHKQNIDYVIKLAKLPDADNNALIRELYGDMTTNLTDKNPDLARYKEESEKLFAVIRDTALLNDLHYQYYMAMGINSYYNNDDMKAIDYLHKLQLIYPNSVRVKAMMEDVVGRMISKWGEKFDDEDIEPQEAADSLMRWALEYPEIQNQQQFKLLLTYVYGETAYDLFEDGDKASIDSYLLNFNKNVEANTYGELKDAIVAAVYDAAQRYFISKNKYALAKDYIQKGLKLSPNNTELLDKLKLITGSGY